MVSEPQAMMISLPEATVARLLAMRETSDECVATVVDRMLSTETPTALTSQTMQEKRQMSAIPQGKYTCEVLGTKLQASTLSSLFGEVIDLINVVAPDALLRLSKERTTKRRHLSQEKAGVHLVARHLPVLRTRSGWWISKNISRLQTIAHLRALCAAAGLEFGKDVLFPVKGRQ
jgi:hypothetical protein